MPAIQIAVMLILTAILFYFLLRLTNIKHSFAGNVHIDTVITVKDAEDSIEQLVKDLAKSRGTTEGCIWVVDLGSTDSTKKIIELLENDYPYVHTLSNQNADSVINTYAH